MQKLLLFLACLLLPFTASAAPILVGQWSTSNAPNDHPYGITVGGGTVFVANQNSGLIECFSTDGAPLRQWVTDSWPYGPHGICYTPNGELLVAMLSRDQVRRYSMTGTLLATYGTSGRNPGQLFLPEDVSIDGSGNFYVGDRGYRIQKFSPTGQFLGSMASPSDYPDGVACRPDGTLYAALDGNHEVAEFSPSGTLVRRWGSQGSGDGQFYFPTGIAVDGVGNVYVADSNNNRIQKFASDGTFLEKWSIGGGLAVDVAVDMDGSVYVLDYSNNHVLKYVEAATPTQRNTWGALKVLYR